MKNKHLLSYCSNGVEGIIKISGSKNASLPIIASVLLCKDEVILENVPLISDVDNLLTILKELNVDCVYKKDSLYLDSSKIIYKDLLMKEVELLRGSYYLIPILLFINNKVNITSIGGCNFEYRPIDLHIDVFKAYGIKHIQYEKYSSFNIEKLTSINYTFTKRSVGATINAILVGVLLQEESIIYNYSHEVEVFEVIRALNLMGCNILYDKEKLSVRGPKIFNRIKYKIIPDRIELETFMIFGLMYGKIICVDLIKNQHLPFIRFLEDIDAKFEFGFNTSYIEKKKINKPLVINFSNEEQLSTDIGPLIMVYALLNNSKMSLFSDSIYRNRINFIAEFNEACFFRNGQVLINPCNLKSNHHKLIGKSLRETMAYILYSFSMKSKVDIEGFEYIYRGYENIIGKLKGINGEVEIYEEE